MAQGKPVASKKPSARFPEVKSAKKKATKKNKTTTSGGIKKKPALTRVGKFNKHIDKAIRQRIEKEVVSKARDKDMHFAILASSQEGKNKKGNKKQKKSS